LAPGAPGATEGRPAVQLRDAVSMAGVCDLAGAFRDWKGGAALELMGVSPERDRARWAAADPRALVPPAARILLIHGSNDEVVSVRLSRDYAAAARAAGAEVELVELAGHEGRHRAHVYPSGRAWRTAVRWITERSSADREGPQRPFTLGRS
jgi:acetyl esterase/lipase